jgi:MraZ protein
MTAEVWNQMYERWTNAEGLTEDEQESVAYQFIAPATPVEVDKTGRMAIPPHIRRYAKLSKDCLVLNLVNWLEVWDEELFFAHVEENRPETKEVMKKMGSLKLFKVD